MELSVMSPVLNQMSLEEALAYSSSLGADSLRLVQMWTPAIYSGRESIRVKRS